MKKSHLLLGLLVVTAAVGYYFSLSEVAEGPIRNSSYVKRASSTSTQTTMNEPFNRSPAEAAEASRDTRKKIVLTKSKPKKISEDLEFNDDLKGLPDGVQVVSNLRVIKKEAYAERMGSTVYSDDEMVFFKVSGEAEDAYTNVAYDKKHEALYPISAVIKLTGIGSAERAAIGTLGHDEYYYNESLKILFVQSSHSKLIPTYQGLLDKGFAANLEIQRAFNMPR